MLISNNRKHTLSIFPIRSSLRTPAPLPSEPPEDATARWKATAAWSSATFLRPPAAAAPLSSPSSTRLAGRSAIWTHSIEPVK